MAKKPTSTTAPELKPLPDLVKDARRVLAAQDPSTLHALTGVLGELEAMSHLPQPEIAHWVTQMELRETQTLEDTRKRIEFLSTIRQFLPQARSPDLLGEDFDFPLFRQTAAEPLVPLQPARNIVKPDENTPQKGDIPVEEFPIGHLNPGTDARDNVKFEESAPQKCATPAQVVTGNACQPVARSGDTVKDQEAVPQRYDTVAKAAIAGPRQPKAHTPTRSDLMDLLRKDGVWTKQLDTALATIETDLVRRVDLGLDHRFRTEVLRMGIKPLSWHVLMLYQMGRFGFHDWPRFTMEKEGEGKWQLMTLARQIVLDHTRNPSREHALALGSSATVAVFTGNFTAVYEDAATTLELNNPLRCIISGLMTTLRQSPSKPHRRLLFLACRSIFRAKFFHILFINPEHSNAIKRNGLYAALASSEIPEEKKYRSFYSIQRDAYQLRKWFLKRAKVFLSRTISALDEQVAAATTFDGLDNISRDLDALVDAVEETYNKWRFFTAQLAYIAERDLQRGQPVKSLAETWEEFALAEGKAPAAKVCKFEELRLPGLTYLPWYSSSEISAFLSGKKFVDEGRPDAVG